MTIENIMQAYNLANDDDISNVERLKRIMNLKIILNNHLDASYDECHYELMRNKKYKLLYQTVRAEFYKRSNAEKFVLEKLITESDPDMQANILQILGHLRSQHALNLSCDFLKHDNVRHREVALFVLGWVGGKEDITLLREHMLHEENPHLRITAASAHRQIGWRLPELKEDLLTSLKEGFEKEKDDEVIAWIIVMIESIAVKRLGLREDKEEPDILHGDVQKAKVKTAKFLAELDL